MKLQVLLSVMDQLDHSILIKTNISTEAIIVNQCKINRREVFMNRSNKIVFISMPDRGVGLSRNTAFLNSTSDLAVFADQDIEYNDNYEKIISYEFEKKPNADIIIFNTRSKNANNPTYMIKKDRRVRRYNCLRYGATKIAIKTDRVRASGVKFSLDFGGGAKYSSGEDSLFLYQCIKKGLRVYACNKEIGTVDQENSTWFTGYNDKFFKDKGVFFYTLSPKLAYIYAIYFVIKGSAFRSNKSRLEILSLVYGGIRFARSVGITS